MKIATNQERLNELFDEDPRKDSAIAEKLGVSKQTISAWRKGIRSPKKPVLLKIAEMYDVSIEWLMGFDVDKKGMRPQMPVFIPDSKLFVEVTKHMHPDDYVTVMTIYEKTYNKMKEKGLLPNDQVHSKP